MLSFPTASWQSSMISNLKSTKTDSSTSEQSPVSPGYGRAASLILPRVYLSDFFTARDEKKMTELGITHMVSVMENTPTTMPNMIRHHVPIADRWNEDILKYLDGTTEFIETALAENETNQVLVHCFQGISRSVAVVCAFVIAQAANGMTAAEAIDFVRSKRGIANPNDGFRVALALYSERFVGNRGKRNSAKINPTTKPLPVRNRKAKISEGIAERIRRFKHGGTAPSIDEALNQVKIEEGA